MVEQGLVAQRLEKESKHDLPGLFDDPPSLLAPDCCISKQSSERTGIAGRPKYHSSQQQPRHVRRVEGCHELALP